MNTKKVFTSSYHPQCDGPVERFNGTLAQSISMYVSSDQKDWDKYLNPVLFAYRVSPSDVTGESPFYMLYGREPLLPMDTSLIPPREISPSIAEHRARIVEHIEIAHRIAKENIQRAQQRMKDYHDRNAVPLKYSVGQRVWVYTPKNRKGLSKKLAHNYHGPYRIVQFLSPVHCILRATDNRRISTTVHITRLKPYVDPSTRPIRQPPEEVYEPFLTEDDMPADSFLPAQPEPSSPPPDTAHGNTEPNVSTHRSKEAEPRPRVSKRRHPRNKVRPTPQVRGRVTTQGHKRNNVASPQASDSADSVDDHPHVDNNVYQVEKLLKQRTINGEQQFFIKWLGYPNSHNSWQPATNIIDDRLITKFYRQHPRARRFNNDPDYTPRVAVFEMAESPREHHVLAAFSHGVIPASSRIDCRFSRHGNLD